MEHCVFCKIIKKEIPAEIIYEDNIALAVLDVNPVTAGHTLVVPKKHCQTVLELAEKEIGLFWQTVNKTMEILKNGLEPDGFTIGINHGKAAGQVIEHLHVHILPRFHNDGGGNIHSIINNPPELSLEQTKNKILQNNIL